MRKDYKAYYIKKLSKGLCATCYNTRGPNTRYCNKCLSVIKLSLQQLRDNDRATAITKYGGSCVFCGESFEPFLTIDHINNDGNKLRLQQRGKNSGFNIYRWLRLNNYPDTVQILCLNCNNGKYKIGEQRLLEILQQHNRLSIFGIARLQFLDAGTGFNEAS